MGWLKELRERRPVLGEVVKQLIDQPLHILMTFGSVLATAALAHFVAVWLPATAPISVMLSMTAGIFVTAGWNVIRELEQWPSSRWWDPPLDWFFEALGIGLGAWAWVAIHAKYLVVSDVIRLAGLG